MGRVFEAMVPQAYVRRRRFHDLPLVEDWCRWEGRDRDRDPVEIEIAARLTDGRVLTGEIEWTRTEERGSPPLYVAAGGFSDEFRSVAEPVREHVYLWTLEDFYDI